MTATDADAGDSIASVQFFQNGTSLGAPVTAPLFNWTWVKLTPATFPTTYSLTAKASDTHGGSTTSSAISVNVTKPPVVSITAPANGTSLINPASFTLTASASDPDGTVTKVEYYINGVLAGSATASPYSLARPNVGLGTYSIFARAYDNLGITTDSTPITVNVVNPQPPSISIASPIACAALAAPATIALSATAATSNPGGSITKVEYYNGAALLGTATASPYTVAWTNVAAGSYSMTAKAYDNGGRTTTSAILPVGVAGPPSVSFSASPALTGVPSTVSLSATAASGTGCGAIPKVEFYNGATLLATDTSSPFVFSWNVATAGNYSLTARAYDAAGQFRDSTAVSVHIVSDHPPRFPQCRR